MSKSATSRLQRQRQAARARERSNLIRAGVFGVVVLSVLFAAGYFLLPLFTPQASGITQTVGGRIINLQAAMDGFDVKEIHVQQGETVTVNLRSLDNSMHTDGGGKHQFAIEELGVNLVAQPLSTNSVTFTADKPGEYIFYCDICCGGKANPTMNGKFVVDA